MNAVVAASSRQGKRPLSRKLFSKKLKSLDTIKDVPFVCPPRRIKKYNRQRVQSLMPIPRPRRKKRRPNRGSTDKSDNGESSIQPCHNSDDGPCHKMIHDSVIARVVGTGYVPKCADFTVKELKSMVQHVGLTPTRSKLNRVYFYMGTNTNIPAPSLDPSHPNTPIGDQDYQIRVLVTILSVRQGIS